MNLEPKILINRQNHVVEFRHGGQIFIFKPSEHRVLDGVVADHALHFTNTGLEEYTKEIEVEEEKQAEAVMPDYMNLPFTTLVSMMGKEYSPKKKMKKTDLVVSLENRWKQRHQSS